MKKNIELLLPNSFYHIYNRGVNRQDIFFEPKNIAYFLKKYKQFVSPFMDTYAYCLLKNHFHIIIRTGDELRISRQAQVDMAKSTNTKAFALSPSLMLGHAFSNLFKSYSLSINKAYNREGQLLEKPFRRILVDNDDYLRTLIHYVHNNAQKHGFVADFRAYPHSSYHTHLSESPTNLKREEVLQLFGGKAAFEEFHLKRSFPFSSF